MNETFKKCVLHNIYFSVLALISIILIVVSFFLPPQGVIDPTVMAGVGELFAWAALGTVLHAIDKDKTISLSHGETTITVNGKTYKLEEEKIDEE